MKPEHPTHYVNSRVLKINVGFLLSDGPGHSRDMEFDFPALRVAEDLDLQYLRGPLRVSRTKEGLLLQGKLLGGIEDECSRCLEPLQRTIQIEIEELFAYPDPTSAEFSIGEDGILDLAPLVRAETLIQAGRTAVCRPDCKGLCPDCGTNLNYATCSCRDNDIDPRFAQLKHLLKD
ncbi:MAG: DUF177 domain-containing protein [Chloroflexi bacterium]|nr:DUF177 domain-containing protein [Chloroflexota bacterium]